MALQIHVLTQDSADLGSALPKIIALYHTIFQAQPQTKHASLDLWKTRLSHPLSTIVYITTDSAPVTDAAGGDPVAFLFAHPRDHSPPLQNGATSSLHIWLAGVLPKWRKMGCLQRMMTELMAKPAPMYTICTIPPRFPDMYAWLQKRAWRFEREASEGRIMLSMRGDTVEDTTSVG